MGWLECVHIKRGGMTIACSDEVFDFGNGTNAGAGADSSAVECCSGAGKFELMGDGPILQERVNEGGVEDVSGAGGIGGANVEGRGVVKICAVESEDAVVAERGRRELVGEFLLDNLERFREIRFAGNSAGNIHAGDEEIDVRKERFDAVVKIV